MLISPLLCVTVVRRRARVTLPASERLQNAGRRRGRNERFTCDVMRKFAFLEPGESVSRRTIWVMAIFMAMVHGLRVSTVSNATEYGRNSRTAVQREDAE